MGLAYSFAVILFDQVRRFIVAGGAGDFRTGNGACDFVGEPLVHAASTPAVAPLPLHFRTNVIAV